MNGEGGAGGGGSSPLDTEHRPMCSPDAVTVGSGRSTRGGAGGAGAPPLRLDIRFRMLMPSELALAMGFPAGYVFKGNRGDVVRQVGNAVEVLTAEALCLAALCG